MLSALGVVRDGRCLPSASLLRSDWHVSLGKMGAKKGAPKIVLLLHLQAYKLGMAELCLSGERRSILKTHPNTQFSNEKYSLRIHPWELGWDGMGGQSRRPACIVTILEGGEFV